MSFPLLSDHAVRYVQQDASTGWPARPAGNGPVFYFGWTEPTGLQSLDLWFPIVEPTADPVAPVITSAGTISGTPTVGSTLSVTGFTATGNPSPTLSYQWQRDSVNISGATSATYVLQAADDETDVRRVTTATNSEGSANAPTAAVSVTYAAPVAGSLSAQVFEQATGVQTIATAGAFTNAEGGAYSVSTVAGVTINSSTGVVSVDTADLLATTSVTVTYTNSGGSDGVTFDLTVQAEAVPGTPDFEDDFNRADAETLGANWISDSTGHRIRSNQAQQAASSSGSVVSVIDQEFAADQFIQAEVQIVSSPAQTILGGVIARRDGANFYRLEVRSDSEWRLRKLGTDVATLATGSAPLANTYLLRLEAQGTTIRALIDGVEVWSDTDASYSTGQLGISSFVSASGSLDQVLIDNVLAGEL